jgi:hypothetical protein
MYAADDDDPNVVILVHGGDQFCDLRADPVEPFRIAHPALSCCALAGARRRAVSRMASTMPW